MKQDLEKAKELLEQLHWDSAYPSGYEELDRLCGGLVKDGVTLIAARPAVGKTSFALNIVSRLSRQPGTILVLSPELLPSEITMRLLSISLDLPPEDFWNGKAMVADKFWDYYRNKESNIQVKMHSFLSIDDVWDFCSSIPDLQLVVIPHVHTICKPMDFSSDMSRWGEREEPERLFRLLQKLARSLEVPILCTAHLHRSLERRKNKRPRLTDLKKCGIPEDMVDQILFLYRDGYYDPCGVDGAELIVAKAAQGKTGTVCLDWDCRTGRLTERT